MKAGRGSGIVENKKSRGVIEKNRERRRVEYSTIGCEVGIVFIIIFKMCKRKSVQ
jgi:hypothetical protein